MDDTGKGGKKGRRRKRYNNIIQQPQQTNKQNNQTKEMGREGTRRKHAHGAWPKTLCTETRHKLCYDTSFCPIILWATQAILGVPSFLPSLLIVVEIYFAWMSNKLKGTCCGPVGGPCSDEGGGVPSCRIGGGVGPYPRPPPSVPARL
eukprot:TRINITY_DN66422_c8_g2_i1.p1 TRINITY_DN66422_c8_g2~~TRINITY_DN66422_c8_g2_i1.p1  ORF type:complete len:148 (+),score=5.08 TRINITY_DN66422_c8_g2_i1:819-1262(+)